MPEARLWLFRLVAIPLLPIAVFFFAFKDRPVEAIFCLLLGWYLEWYAFQRERERAND